MKLTAAAVTLGAFASAASIRSSTRSKLLAKDAGFCPDWALGKTEYAYDPSEWGGDIHKLGIGAWTGQATEQGMAATACAWVASCKSQANGKALDTCLGRCPTAVAIAQGESNWNPMAQAYDGVGRGLWQVGGRGAPPPVDVFNKTCQGANPGHDADVRECNAFNPLHLGEWVVKTTQDGDNWAPPGRCWSTCSGGACAATGTGWTQGWVPKFISPSSKGGCQAVSESKAAAEACNSAIKAITDKKLKKFIDVDSCVAGEAPSPSPAEQYTCVGVKCSNGSDGSTCTGASGCCPYSNTPTQGRCSCGTDWTDANQNAIPCKSGAPSPAPPAPPAPPARKPTCIGVKCSDGSDGSTCTGSSGCCPFSNTPTQGRCSCGTDWTDANQHAIPCK